MAALTTAGVTVLRAANTVVLGGPRLTQKRLTLVLDGAGTASTNTIDATTLGFTTITDCSNAIKDDDAVVVIAVPSYDGSKILLIDVSKNEANTATRDVPLDITGLTIRITVTGYTA